jgi:chromatin licensing and DNA replication factor 1
VRSLAEALNSPTNIKEPAHLKFRQLSEKVPEIHLTLPMKFRLLIDTFKCLDTVLSMIHSRKEPCTFDKVKKGVEQMSRKAFDLSKLALISTVYSEAFELSYDRQTKMSKELTSKLEFMLIIKPSSKTMSPSVILKRRQEFIDRLLDIVHDHHQEYLQSRSPPLNIAKNQLVRWHPQFKVENVPDIEISPTALPVAPLKADLSTAQKCLDHTRARLCIPKSPPKTDSVPEAQLNSPVKITSGALKGISTALLDKIKAKEARRASLEMTRPPEVEKKISMIKRLPDFIRMINNYFTGERKATLSLDSVVLKCKESYYQSISCPEVQDFVKLLSELLPDWLFILEVKKGTFVKIDKSKSIEALIERLKRHAEFLKTGNRV